MLTDYPARLSPVSLTAALYPYLGFGIEQVDFACIHGQSNFVAWPERMTFTEDCADLFSCQLGDQGKQVHGAMLDLFGSIEGFRSAVGAAKGELTGTVEFGAVDPLYTNEEFPLHKAIGEFSTFAPNATLNLHIASPQELLQGLIMGRFHVILTPTRDLPNAAESFFVFREDQQLYCGSQHALFNTDDKSITP